MLPIFPAHLFNPQAIKADVKATEISGGTALNGDETTILTDGGGRWGITYSGISLRTPRLLRLWNMWSSHMPGRAFFVPLVSLHTAPRPIAGGSLARPSAIEANDDDFPTSVRYAAPYISAHLALGYAVRATQMSITVAQGARIEGGERLSVAGRAFTIERVLSRDGQTAVVTVSPPARAAASTGDEVNFEWPVVQCKLVPGQDLAPDLAFGQRAQVAISFVEDFSDAN